LKVNNSIFLNTSVQSFEYESCRSHYHLQSSQRPYRVFINRCCTKDVPTLNANQLPWIGDVDLWASFSPFSTQNLKCPSTWKLCPSTSWTTFIKVDFKCLGEFWRTQKKFRKTSRVTRGGVGFDQGFDHGLIPHVCPLDQRCH
jgi:hypothetical protein